MRRAGSHALPLTGRPEVVEEFASAPSAPPCSRPYASGAPPSPNWNSRRLAQYAADCAPARTILVEHDVTFDLYQQLLPSAMTAGNCAANSTSGASSKPTPGRPWIASSP